MSCVQGRPKAVLNFSEKKEFDLKKTIKFITNSGCSIRNLSIYNDKVVLVNSRQNLFYCFPANLGSFDTGYDHLYLVYVADAANEIVIRGGSEPECLLSCNIVVEEGLSMDESEDNRPNPMSWTGTETDDGTFLDLVSGTVFFQGLSVGDFAANDIML